ncbi:hypothetical protein D3C72_1104960 [compost metagenome]
MMGLVSCAIYLKEHPTAQVLYIAADEKVPETYQNSLSEENTAYAAAFLLSNSGAGLQLDFEMSSNPRGEKTSLNQKIQALEFLNWIFSSASSTKIDGELMSWDLNKCLKL